MAGGGHYSPVKVDPAIERWGFMRQTVYERFRLTPRNTWIVLVLGALIPYGTFKLAQATDLNQGRWKMDVTEGR
ncbi:hypothetical protein IE81DRAFT_346531 [Ceraceosorus guamensis]|uniref:NADH dehydrogenase [ubiquinone] 1 beta subcomplex subunit 4 n=1 Tax=Ceraceosorus guamensis TaxID=1522189 RepID=A0A316W1I3_9BASI|nr:hypothetical protein IE81DRAFT_346531 [Ceraceosorus guamensis]PWN43539.1 hypothetical protein IE81DRAFT_346531 [Ceraceosorus guamensis]